MTRDKSLELIEFLFAKLAVRYGRVFMHQYQDADLDFVKADWAEVLDGVSQSSIAYAFGYLPFEKPPTAMQFREICRKAPPKESELLPPPVVPADSAKVREIVGRLAKPNIAPIEGFSLASECMRNIERVTNGGNMSSAQRHVYNSCRRVVQGTFTPTKESTQ